MATRGRPTKYTDEMPELLYKAMSDGKSVVQFCASQDICTDTFYEWVKVHKDFSDTFRVSKIKCEAHWESWLMENLSNKNVNGLLTKFYFTNRFQWSDKKEVKQDIGLVAEEVKEVREARKAYEDSFKKEY